MTRFKIIENTRYCEIHNCIYSKYCKNCAKYSVIDTKIIFEKHKIILEMLKNKLKIERDFRDLYWSKICDVDRKYYGENWYKRKRTKTDKEIYSFFSKQIQGD